jgi:hypothetical protein
MAVAIKMDIVYFPDNDPPDFSAQPRHLGVGGLPQRGADLGGVTPDTAGATALETHLDEEYPENAAA